MNFSPKNFVLPFTAIPSRFVVMMAGAQCAIALLLWFFSGSKFLPSPIEVGQAWVHLAQTQGLVFELWESAKVLLVALVLSSVLSLVIAALSTASLFSPVAQFVSVLRFLGFAGLTFIFMLLTNDAYQLKLALLVFGITVMMVTSLLAEVRAIPLATIDYCKTLGMKHWRITFETVVLGKADVFLDLLRQNAAIGWTLLTMVEGITRSQGGIGAMLLNQNRYFQLSGVFAIQITILLYGLLQDYLLGLVRGTMCPHLCASNHGGRK